MSKDTEEERAARHPLRFQVAYDDGEGFMTGTVVDVSSTGAFIETTMPLKPGTTVSITPLLPGESGLFEIEAEVMRTTEYDSEVLMELPPGMGVRFKGISDEERAVLTKMYEDAETARKADQGS
jgi:uncharacterized protein (TIGR02266 family)